jgi:hypothetical protein
MNVGRTVFSQLIEYLPSKEFQKCVARYLGDSRLRGFSCWDRLLAMSFAQLTYRESLRDIEACLRSMSGKLYHMGLRGKVARSTLGVGASSIQAESRLKDGVMRSRKTSRKSFPLLEIAEVNRYGATCPDRAQLRAGAEQLGIGAETAFYRSDGGKVAETVYRVRFGRLAGRATGWRTTQD